MVPPGLTQQQIATFRHVFDALFEFLRWTYGVAIGGLDRTVLQNRILVYNLPDASAALLDQHLAIYKAVREGDPSAARRAAMDHITYVEQAIAEVERTGDWRRVARLRLNQRS